ncbi:MAG: acyltransferase [Chroococcidiopsidaceae cyanobacterium CP_BM_RX_35]|nr:acyltransferase [Chroococcidiopsidaceae cyanobacterium CP_BM_RX_35]
MAQHRDEIQFSSLPLTVYREIAAHLRQVEGIQTGLCPAATGQFDYNQSQVGSLWIQYAQTASPQSREQVEQILAYYRDRYGLNN